MADVNELDTALLIALLRAGREQDKVAMHLRHGRSLRIWLARE
jgi:hypothetical protein